MAKRIRRPAPGPSRAVTVVGPFVYTPDVPDLTGQLPSSLRENARWERLGPDRVPVMLVHPDWTGPPAPLVLWMHGRTVTKELDPGRYLRWMRAGIASCAIDLPGHGERLDPDMHDPARTLDVVRQMVNEIDTIVEALAGTESFDTDRAALGGMSAGGMAAMVRLCHPHSFRCASVEATSGSWRHQRNRDLYDGAPAASMNPIEHLDGWREIPFQALHTRTDQWVAFEGQQSFIEALRTKYRDPDLVELIVYEATGAPYEHAGFGRMAGDAKDRQAAFFERWLAAGASTSV